MPSVYLETTIPSYLTAWRSPEIVMAARQEITRDWWDHRRRDFELFVSQLVIDEASAGDPGACGATSLAIHPLRSAGRDYAAYFHTRRKNSTKFRHMIPSTSSAE
jgi:hypothetical protein